MEIMESKHILVYVCSEYHFDLYLFAWSGQSDY